MLLSIDCRFPATLSVRASQDRTEALSFAAALRSLAAEPLVLVSFSDCTYADLAALAALAAHENSQAAPLVVIVPEDGFVRKQFELSGLDRRIGIVPSFELAHERARRLQTLRHIGELAHASVAAAERFPT